MLIGLFADQIGVNNWFLLSGLFVIGIAVLSLFFPAIRELGRPKNLSHSVEQEV